MCLPGPQLGLGLAIREGGRRRAPPIQSSPPRDLALSVAALSYNLWFQCLSCVDMKLVRGEWRGETMGIRERVPRSLSCPPPCGPPEP